MSKEAMKLALMALEKLDRVMKRSPDTDKAITALKQALEQPEPEPVAWTDEDFTELIVSEDIAKDIGATVPLYISPPKREPLTDERLELIGHADPTINNIYVFSGYGEEVPEGRTPIYAGYKAAHGIKGEA